MIVYHGSNKNFDRFQKSAKRVDNDFFGGGVGYFTDDQKVALTYSRAMTYRYKGEEHLYKVRLKMNNIFDVDTIYTGKNLSKFFKHIKPEDFARGAGLLKAGEDKYSVLAKLEMGNYQLTGKDVFRGLSKGFGQSEKAQDILMKLGYDGLRYNGGENMGTGRHNVYIPYNEKDIQILNKYKVNRKKSLNEAMNYDHYIKTHKKEVKTLNVWDIDDTLFKTDARIIIKKDGKVIKRLTPMEYNTFEKAPDEEVDFSEFRSGKVFRETAKPIKSVLDRAKSIIWNQSENSKSILLTARSDLYDHKEFLQAFRDHGFPIDHVYVERSGNLHNSTPASKTHILKAVVLKKYINTGQWNRVRIWDDSKANLEMLLKLARNDVEIIAYHVDHDGKVTKYGEKKPSKNQAIIGTMKSLSKKKIKEDFYSQE